MKPEKMKMLSEAKVRFSFPKNIKFHILPVFWAISRFYQKFHWKVYGWKRCEPNLIFFLVVISIALSFQIKKSNSKNFVHMGFRGRKASIKIWDFAAGMDSFTQWILNKKSQMPDSFRSNIPSIFYGNNHFHLIVFKP